MTVHVAVTIFFLVANLAVFITEALRKEKSLLLGFSGFTVGLLVGALVYSIKVGM